MPGPAPDPASSPMGPGSVSLRLYPHNELAATEIVDRLCTMAATAADVGFDGVMTSEHHGGFAGYLPNPLQVTGFQLSAMARGWAAAAPVLLPLRPVGLLAEEVAWLDARFPGRVGIGVGPGSLPLDFEAMDADLADAVPRFKRDLPRLAAMLRGDELGTARRRPGPVGPRPGGAGDPDGEHRHEPGRGAGGPRRAASASSTTGPASSTGCAGSPTSTPRPAAPGPRVLVRRVWLGEPPTGAFDAQFDVYKGYTPAERQEHWRGSGWMTGDDAEPLADELATVVQASGATCLNLRIHAPGVDPDAAQEQIGVLGRELLPRLRPCSGPGGGLSATGPSARPDPAARRDRVRGPSGSDRGAGGLEVADVAAHEGAVELGVEAVGRQQLVVATPLDDAAAVEHQDLVGADDGGQAMGDHHGGATRERRGQRLLHQRLVLGVEVAGGLVEHHDRGVLHQHPGDGQPLALTTRQAMATLAHHGVVAVGQAP